ncbi:MAG: ATP-binding protein [Eubacteriales bacterium]
MKHSIRRQMSILFILVMVGTLISCWIMNSIFLVKYYQSEKKTALLEVYYSLVSAAQVDSIFEDEYAIELQKLCEKYSLSAIVLNSESKVMLSTVNEPQNMTNQLFMHVFNRVLAEEVTIAETDDYEIQIVVDEMTQTEYVQMWGILPNSNLFLLRAPLEGLRDSVDIANRFLAYVGMLAVVIGTSVIYMIARKLTKPIQELTRLSQSMSNLEFEKKYIGEGDNEIAILGKNMNHLSDALQETIRELKEANLELKHDLKLKNEMEMMRKEFVSNISHEFKTPIALIHGYAEGLVDDVDMDADNRKFYCDVILDETIKMNQMVQKLMTLNQLESGTEQVEFQRFDIMELIHNYIQTLDILLKQQGVTMTCNTKDSIYVWGDEFQVEEVVRNYISNAMNHVKEPNCISIRLEAQEEKVRISVFNTGLPIPEESISQIWSKFYKVDKARTREYGGSGVGLSIVKAIVEGMNQEYGVCNYEDGVEFWFTLDRH